MHKSFLRRKSCTYDEHLRKESSASGLCNGPAQEIRDFKTVIRDAGEGNLLFKAAIMYVLTGNSSCLVYIPHH